ncbi:MAG: glutamate 5-kinase [Clostridiales Family XIII bacterium]|jgi:glutamate 5-kinase|nr:glutamate 5-kinase [Clostridiales Family XIII bacterium]
MSRAGQILGQSRKIVLKIGSNVLTGKNGSMDLSVMQDITDQVSALTREGKRVVVVSSGAQIAGVRAISMWNRHKDINYKQALCAIGQVELMLAYKSCFAKNDITVGQLLLTRHDFSGNTSMLHIRNTLFTLLDEGVVPIINENDSVGIEEFTLGDNDYLAALTANLWSADLLVLMSDIDGVFDHSPKERADAKLIREVDDIARLREDIEITGMSDYGTGGMASKIDAAEEVGRFGTPVLLVNGKQAGVLHSIAAGEETGTVFLPERRDRT